MSIRIAQAVRRRRLSLALGTSALAWGLALPSSAQAQCAPDPTVANGTTTCAGTDTNGILVTTPYTTLTVASGASVTNSGAPAITVDVSSTNSYSYATDTINVLGSVSAAGQNAITVRSGTAPQSSYYGTQQLILTVGVGGSLSGTTALALLQSPGNTYGTISASIDNAGTLTGTGGIALLGNAVTTNSGYTSALASFSSITNRATGSIVGGIVGPVYSLANAGSIDGGTGSAVDSGNFSSPVVTNISGATIRSASAAATILAGSGYSLSVTNAGTIANTGSGAALSGGMLTVTNQAGGKIAGGSTAIAAATSLNLINQGTVTGNVVAGNGANTIDSTAGTITGSVTLGSGYDTLIARYVGTRTLATGITGAINAGGGTNTERVAFATDTSVTTPIDLASGFQQLVLAPAANVTATLQTGFSTATALVLSGTGSIVNRATIGLVGPAVTDLDYAFGTTAAFRNEGSITAAGLNSQYAVTLSNHSFTNTGTVTAIGGGGVSMSYNPVNNSGTITASGTGVYLFDGVLSNSGTIVSTAGTGAYLIGNVGYTGSNSGTIRGATVGANTGIYLTNTGTISSAGVGVAVQPYGYLINAAGGVVNGGSGGAATVSAFNAGIANAGTINGNVTYSGVAGIANNLTYIALTGGTLNGNLALGAGATLVTDLINTGTGAFAGITGTVTAGTGATLRYAVNADATAILPTGGVGPFTSVGYQLANNAKLKLTSPAAQTSTQTLLLAGTGVVDLNAAIAVSGASAIQSTAAITYPGAAAATAALSITSRGGLAVTRTSNSVFGGAVLLSSADSFTNLGSIAVTDRFGYATAAIYGGASATNSGQISLDGGIGISGATAVINTGNIVQTSGGLAARGVSGFTTLVNSGTIRVAGSAVQLSSNSSGIGSTITNAGTLASTGGAAITADAYYYSTTAITNQASGTITGIGSAIQLAGATLTNAGTINGTVDLGYYSAMSRSYTSSSYVAAGGTIAGDLLFGSGNDLLLQTGDSLSVSGTIDGGTGTNIFGRTLSATGTVALGTAGLRNFQDALVEAVGAATVVTTTATDTFAGNLYAVGTGSVVNQASIAGALIASVPDAASTLLAADRYALSSLSNAGTVAGGVSGTVAAFANSGTIGSTSLGVSAVVLNSVGTLTASNSGTILSGSSPYYYYYPYYYYSYPAVSLSGYDSVSVNNSGTIGNGGLSAQTSLTTGVAGALAVTNSGTITAAAGGSAVSLALVGTGNDSGGAITLANTGTIAGQGATGYFANANANGVSLAIYGTTQPTSFAITNAGTISAVAAQSTGNAVALAISGTGLGSGTITNAAGGTITATGPGGAYGILVSGTGLSLVNAGTISAVGGMSSTALQTYDSFANTIRNTGTITGDVRLAAGVDTVDNAGSINGTVALGAGDDTFIQRVGGTVTGLVDGGDGTDGYTIDTTGGTTTLAAVNIARFEQVTQVGTGTGFYSGSFDIGTITLAGGTLAVAVGQTLATAGVTTVSASAASGSLTVVNNGTIAGAVQLGAGNDTFVEGVGSVVTGGVDGGAGTNLYRVVLAGDRTGIGARSNFQNLAVDGSGTLTLGLDQNFQSIALTGTSLTLALRGYSVGQITATGTATQLAIDGDVGAVQLGAGNDTLSIGAAMLAGRYDGGAGTDSLRLTATGAVTLSGTATGFETVALTGSALTIAGTLGTAGQALAFTGGDKAVTVARGGTLAGTIDLGAGNDRFRLTAGGTLTGTVSGGAGTNAATLDLTGGDLTLRAGTLTNFQQLTTEGSTTLTLAGGAFTYDTVTAAGNLAVAADASLAARVVFGPADNRLVIAGGFAGSVDGGAGADSIDVSGGSAAAPVAFSSISNVEAYRMSSGFATVSGAASLGSVTLNGGRLVGLAGSTLSAASFSVGQGATFGSAGTVNGSVSVAGILSPGASPGTMTVNGNVALAATSTSLFEITPTVSDKLVVNGAVSIASGATLQLAATSTIAPGTILDLVTATGGITGSYTTILKPASLFGFVVQDGNRIRLLGEFLNDTSYAVQTQRSIDYVNNVLISGRSSAALLAAVPLLLTQSGSTNPTAFAQLAPQAYASATQIAVENGLTLADAARGDAFAPTRDTPGVFTFASMLSGTRTLGADILTGATRTTTNGYGFLGGIGVAGTDWSVGAFGGYLNDRQTLAGLGARTNADGVVAGVHGRVRYGVIGIKATAAYDGARADTRRALPGGAGAGRYGLHSWILDASIDAVMPFADGWTVRPSLGGTAIRTMRNGVTETGGSPFALTVAGRRSTAAFVDGGLTFGGTIDVGGVAATRPYLTIGARYQAEGRTPYALAGLGGGELGLLAAGAPRAPVLATVTVGADVALSSRLMLFGALSGESGNADHRAAARGGLRLAF